MAVYFGDREKEGGEVIDDGVMLPDVEGCRQDEDLYEIREKVELGDLCKMFFNSAGKMMIEINAKQSGN